MSHVNVSLFYSVICWFVRVTDDIRIWCWPWWLVMRFLPDMITSWLLYRIGLSIKRGVRHDRNLEPYNVGRYPSEIQKSMMNQKSNLTEIQKSTLTSGNPIWNWKWLKILSNYFANIYLKSFMSSDWHGHAWLSMTLPIISVYSVWPFYLIDVRSRTKVILLRWRNCNK